MYDISNVIIRGDTCSERINGAEIHIGNSLINNGNNNPRVCWLEERHVESGGDAVRREKLKVTARLVVPPEPGMWAPVAISLDPLPAYGPLQTDRGTVIHFNVAPRGIATQSSLMFNNFYASFAIDGNRASNMGSYSCTHTNIQNNPWWRVDLLAVYDITKVIVTNRGDCCLERINGAVEIHIGNSLINNGNNDPR
ncbi:fucolectin-3-like [Hemibagrus wyckioides]|uniref:fucolectin-3-like n=1 Tax=Hemibagrus wyckioides TaxID=337641 RepID=UPI00266C975E|nr:fucolectin-3-like [Hemibagrus wyckioides]